MERRLAAILAADMVGFSSQMQADEVGTLRRLKQVQSELIAPQMSAHRGRIFKTTGDGFLAEFASAIDALNCAVAIQQAISKHNLSLEACDQSLFRMGINIGDIIIDDDDVYGDGVNIAARLEPIAAPGGILVTDALRSQLLNKVNAAFEPVGRQKLKNIVDAVDVYRVTAKDLPSFDSLTPGKAARAGSRRPVLAILPFDNMSSDPEQDHLADGITEDLITTLSQIGHLSVVSRNSAFTFKNRAVSAQEVGRELQARFVLTGSLRKSGNRIRIAVQLTDTETEAHLWAVRYDRDLEDIFAVQDEITLTIATALQVELTEGEQARLRYTTTDNVTAWTSFIRGLSLFRTVSAETYRQARRCFEEALVADPNSAQIHAMLACVHAIEGRFFWTADHDHSLELAKEHADRALAIAEDTADAWAALGYWHLCGLRLDESVAAYRRAVELAPDHADLRALYALALTFAERPEEAVLEAQTAMRLNPLDPGWYCGVLGHAYRYAGRFDDALSILSEYNRQSPGFGLVDMVLTYADLGDMDNARGHAKALLAARPEFTVANWARTQNCADPQRLIDDRQSLANAGLP
ncbi:adenylate/guanylate cyclase domain-containing protein [Pelagibius litoralis]|uniref:Adenylate/guanylate cyclase domain-containing protein n=1 Tax=Pelagibius litoralis TaxID=374515 RepID=A0A967C6K4_9PROT|nr:adenylate/guanylate cyclase domain-containing protein [Pelagibius litoralis]NIA68456.1 adenylate/guanylate cyclase domain-containing protein [Pelagibius litoralis]